MANQIEEFFKIRASIKEFDSDIDNTITGFPDFVKIKGIDVIIKEIIRSLVIVRGSYVFDPSYGSGLHRYIFEPIDTVTLRNIEREIESAIDRIDTVYTVNYNVRFFKDKKGYRIDISIKDENSISKDFVIDIDESVLTIFNR